MSFQSDSFKKQRDVSIQVEKATSRLAKASLWCSLIFFFPVTVIAAPILGLAALWEIKSNAAKTGEKLAKTGIALGLVLTVVHAYLGFAGTRFYNSVHTSPEKAIAAGFGGNVDGFVEAFDDTATAGAGSEAEAFLAELESRYGAFEWAAMDMSDGWMSVCWRPGETFDYTLQFANGTVRARSQVMLSENLGELGLTSRLGFLVIEDPNQGDLAFPRAAAPAGAIATGH